MFTTMDLETEPQPLPPTKDTTIPCAVICTVLDSKAPRLKHSVAVCCRAADPDDIVLQFEPIVVSATFPHIDIAYVHPRVFGSWLVNRRGAAPLTPPPSSERSYVLTPLLKRHAVVLAAHCTITNEQNRALLCNMERTTLTKDDQLFFERKSYIRIRIDVVIS